MGLGLKNLPKLASILRLVVYNHQGIINKANKKRVITIAALKKVNPIATRNFSVVKSRYLSALSSISKDYKW
jgi:hypothetical protein